MRFFSKTAAIFGIVLCLGLSGCDNEASQRKEFIDFLQTRILDKQGTHVPQLSDNQKEAFGPYAKDYAIIAEFNADGAASTAGATLSGIMAKGGLNSISDLTKRRDDIVSAKASVKQLGDEIDQALAKADAAKAQLKQPDDLKAVFDKAYDRDVTSVATTIKGAVPTLESLFDSALQLSDFLTQHKDSLQISGVSVTANNQQTLNALQPLLNDFSAKARAVQDLQRKFMSLAYGNDQP